MTYDGMERSVADAIRVDLFTVALPGITYRLCSGTDDVTFDGLDYSVATISASTIPLVPIGGQVREVTVSIAANHPLSIALRQGGIPPQDSLVTIRRIHIGDSGSLQWWQGYVGSTRTDHEYTHIRVPNKIDLAFTCPLPAKTAERRCAHVLYDVGCGVDAVAGGFRITPTVSSVTGTTVVVSSISGKPNQWARNGQIKRVADGERRDVVDQVGTTLVIDYPFRTLENGDALEVYAGCDRTLLEAHGCKVKFNNVINFGGEPQMPDTNPSSPTGLGVVVEV